MINNIPLEHFEYKQLQEKVKTISLALMKHENKNYSKAGFPVNNYKKILIDAKEYFCVGTNIFIGIVEEVLTSATKQFPKNFGSDNAVSVVHTINKNRILHPNTKNAIQHFATENFMWIFDSLENSPENKILRIDLYRKLEKIKSKKRKWEFIGGLFHALKHFSIQNRPLSTGTDINNIQNVQQLIFLIATAFFTSPGKFQEDEETYILFLELNEKYVLKMIFYLEKKTGIYFIKTIHKKKKTTANSGLAQLGF